MTDTNIAAGLELALNILRDGFRDVSEWHPVDADLSATYTAAIAAITGAADALHKARSSLQWHAARLNKIQAVQPRMRDPERTMVCDILANGALLEPAGSRYAIPQPAPDLSAVTAERDALAARLEAIERAEPVAVVAPGWQLFWASAEPISVLLKRHPGVRIGSRLYAHPQPPGADHPEEALEMVRPPAAEPSVQGDLLRLDGEMVTIGHSSPDDLAALIGRPSLTLQRTDGTKVMLIGMTMSECMDGAAAFLDQATFVVRRGRRHELLVRGFTPPAA